MILYYKIVMLKIFCEETVHQGQERYSRWKINPSKHIQLVYIWN